MHILMIGINHRTAPVELREKLTFPEGSQRRDDLFDRLRTVNPHAECVVLSTCNRTELYLARPELEAPRADALSQIFAEIARADAQAIHQAAVIDKNDQAVSHLFEVAAGLDSMVVGEPQILGQVKSSYDDANRRHAVGPILHRVFQQAIATAKVVRTQTAIGSGRVSVGSVAVDFARQIFSTFSDKTIVAIGAGDIAKSMLRYLHQLEPRQLWLTNRTQSRAWNLVRESKLDQAANVGVRPYEQLDDLLVEADIILTSTGAPHAIITADRFKSVRRRRKGRPLFIIDIALPRDVEREVGQHGNVYLYDLDDLQKVVARSHEHRCEEIASCRSVIQESVRTCMSRIQNRDVGQLIHQLRTHLQHVGEEEQQRSLRKLNTLGDQPLSEDVERVLAEHTHRLINKFLHLPMTQLDQRKSDAPLGFAAAALRHLFRLDEHQPTDSQDQEQAGGVPTRPADTQTSEAEPTASTENPASPAENPPHRTAPTPPITSSR